MLGKVKQWLGIEGVKLELRVPEDFNPRQQSVSGTIRLLSKQPQTVTGIQLVLIEKYSRGRDEEQLVDEYELGRHYIDRSIDVPGGGVPVDLSFHLTFERLPSPVEEFADRNPLFQGLGWLAKKARGARSEFRVEAEARVRGVGLSPFDRVVL